MPGELSIDLTWEELKSTLPAFGFELDEERLVPNIPYARNGKTLLQMSYTGIFFVARKARQSTIPPAFGYDEESKGNIVGKEEQLEHE
jgi:hypothetical protein